MALVKKILEQPQYDGAYFIEILRKAIQEDGVLSGLRVEEKQVGNQVFAVLKKGAFHRGGIIYIIDEDIDGETSTEHDLEITQFANDPAYNYGFGSDLRFTGFETLYLVETNTDPNDPSREPVFKITDNTVEGDIIISTRKIDWIVRADDDPLADNVLIQDPGNPEPVVFAKPDPELKVYDPNDTLACNFKIGDPNDPFYEHQVVAATPVFSDDLTEGLGGSAIASSTSFGAPAQTVDNNFNPPNGWGSGTATNEWVGIDLGSAQVVNRVRFKGIDNAVNNYRIEAADDAGFTTGLVTLHTGVYPAIGEPIEEIDLLSNMDAKQFYRIFIIDNHLPLSQVCAIREWELFSITAWE